MAFNDSTVPGTRGMAGVRFGAAKPTVHSTTDDPLKSNAVKGSTTTAHGVGAGAGFVGDVRARRRLKESAGVIEARPGIIESCNIEPLKKDSNKDDGFANATQTSSGTGKGTAAGLANMAYGTAQMAYGFMTGDQAAKDAGSEAVYGRK